MELGCDSTAGRDAQLRFIARVRSFLRVRSCYLLNQTFVVTVSDPKATCR